MEFRKKSHKEEMPYLVRKVLRPHLTWSNGSTVGLNCGTAIQRDPYVKSEFFNPFRGWKLFRNVNSSQIHEILNSYWPQASEKDASATIGELIFNGFLRKTPNPEIFQIAQDPEKLQNSAGIPSRYSSLRTRKKGSPGVCPTCGFTVENANRHNNAAHRETECKEFQVKKILQE